MELREYKDEIKLHETWLRPEPFSSTGESAEAYVSVLGHLISERSETIDVPEKQDERSQLLRALLNIRPPGVLPEEKLLLLDRILWTERLQAGIVETDGMGELWRGDITRLAADAIVNAANSQMLGCFHPLHACIDNVIHSAAGSRLREDCNKIMQQQGYLEPTGEAKITRAYNLPSRYVLHTVGPIVEGSLTVEHRRLLASSYTACLDLAAEVEDLRSVAFCCISTGVFGYPKEDAARTAVKTVREWDAANPGRFDRIIFNVFTGEDHDIYRRCL